MTDVLKHLFRPTSEALGIISMSLKILDQMCLYQVKLGRECDTRQLSVQLAESLNFSLVILLQFCTKTRIDNIIEGFDNSNDFPEQPTKYFSKLETFLPGYLQHSCLLSAQLS